MECVSIPLSPLRDGRLGAEDPVPELLPETEEVTRALGLLYHRPHTIDQYCTNCRFLSVECRGSFRPIFIGYAVMPGDALGLCHRKIEEEDSSPLE